MSTDFPRAAAIWIAAEEAKAAEEYKMIPADNSDLDHPQAGGRPYATFGPTSAARLRAALTTLNWSGRSLARIIGEDERKVRRWASGDYEPPDQLLVWLETLAAFHDKNPPPAKE